ncbi:MAG: 6-bladed beta-propeller [Gammaproteobacteria bacterium]|nr:MAG: 6-bladed beta-propeller [Gammaproteobacteria bacterium]
MLPALLLAGCAGAPAVLELQPDAPPGGRVERVWPQPPERARFRYLGELRGEENFRSPRRGVARAGARVLRFLVGLGGRQERPRILQRPVGVAVDEAAGRVYVADVSRQAVYVFDERAGRLLLWDRSGPRAGFLSPVGVAPAGDGGVWVSDSALKVVVRLDAGGRPVARIGPGPFQRPTGLAYDPAAGRLYVADTAADRILVLDGQGRVLGTLGRSGEGPGELNGPTFLCLHEGRLYVADTLNARIQVLDPRDGRPLLVFGRRGVYLGDTPRPKGVAVDRDGRIYVVESYFDFLLVFDAQGRLLLPIGGTGSAPGRFYLPAGAWADGHDRVYVADSFNGRVVVLQYLRGGG